MTRYVIDSSSLVELEEKYPKDIFVSLWETIFDLFDEGILFSVNEVYGELHDSQITWKDYKDCFRELTIEESNKVGEILESDKFRVFVNKGLNDSKDDYWADPHLIACAIVGDDVAVVTQENLNNNPERKIPYVCKHYGVSCFVLLDLLRKLEFKL